MELLQVLKRGLQQVSGHGSLRGYLRVFFRANDVRVGTLVGEDKYGNKYYEDNKQFFGRHRWVIYTTEMNGKNTFWDVDGSMVPPEWHRWFHCMTDDPPTTKPPTARKNITKRSGMKKANPRERALVESLGPRPRPAPAGTNPDPRRPGAPPRLGPLQTLNPQARPQRRPSLATERSAPPPGARAVTHRELQRRPGLGQAGCRGRTQPEEGRRGSRQKAVPRPGPRSPELPGPRRHNIDQRASCLEALPEAL
ncbi:hypothetical protein GH733_016797 [Mirounga leonina]|nr:hypothetical protein GH733_016797 [Mirounga leonina]